MTSGYDKPLYVLPFDHRATFSKNMFGWNGQLTQEQTAEIAAVKQVIYDFLEPTGRLPRRQDHLRRGRRADRHVVPRVGGPVREGPR